ncbi:MAG: hypothetical protein QG608_3126 [Actinomycetota bacterium]|nr:hypothetical protein [Actinomycetota bacterium]
MCDSLSIAPGVVCRQTNSGLRMLFDPDSGVMYELNDTASEIVSLLIELQPTSAQAVADRMVEVFDAPADEVRQATHEFLADFVAAHVVTARP